MYYYIFDIKKCKKRTQVEEIKTYLGSLGISGEFTYPTAAMNAEELVDLGLSKKYTTIVAIGGEEIASAVAGRLLGRKEALGIIPLESSTDLNTLIGTSNWKNACESLRFRKISEIHLGQTAAGSVFLTSVKLDVITPVDITLEFKDYLIQARIKDLVVSNFRPELKKFAPDHLDITMTSVDPCSNKLLSTLASVFGLKSEQVDKSHSLFRARSLRVFAKKSMPLIMENKLIAKTPQLIESTDEKLRLITAKNAAKIWEAGQ